MGDNTFFIFYEQLVKNTKATSSMPLYEVGLVEQLKTATEEMQMIIFTNFRVENISA